MAIYIAAVLISCYNVEVEDTDNLAHQMPEVLREQVYQENRGSQSEVSSGSHSNLNSGMKINIKVQCMVIHIGLFKYLIYLILRHL